MLRLGRISGHTVNGGWSSWSSWSQCSRDCSRGIRSRKRTCSNPEPKYGGQTCLGQAQEYQECNITPCPGKKMHTYKNGTCSFKLQRHSVHRHHWHNRQRTHRVTNDYCTWPEVNYLAACLIHSHTDKYTLLHTILKLCFSLING